MSYQVKWIIENQVLYIQQAGDVSLDDLRASSKLIADHIFSAYAATPENVVIGIVDMSDARFGSLLRAAIPIVVKQVADIIDPRIWDAKPGFTVLVTSSERAKLAISLVIKISAQPLTTVATLDEALTVISAMYPELRTQLESYKLADVSTDSGTG